MKETGDQQSTKLKYELLIPQDFIKKHYEILTQIFVLFHRDRISAECFNLEYLKQILNEPRDLLEFIAKTFTHWENDIITAVPTHDFIKRASKYFGITEREAKQLLVYDVNNKTIFPLFVRFRNDHLRMRDVVCISKDFSRFIYTILHVVMTKNFFDDETVERSKDFESQKVKIKFEEIGFTYVLDVTDKKKAYPANRWNSR